MGINCEEMEMILYTNMGMGWEWEYGHENGREWDRKSHSCTSLDCINEFTLENSQFYAYYINL